MKVAFRCDASPAIGAGHLMRCLTLADELRRQGAQCVFLGAGETMAHASRISERGHAFIALEQGDGDIAPEAEAQVALAALPWTPDWIVVDHYRIDWRWQAVVRQGGLKVAVIDDLADRRHDCDLLIDHNLSNLGEDRYGTLIPASCGRALGPRHALISPAYAERRKPRDAEGAAVRRILLFITAGDDGGRTEAILQRLGSGRWASLEVDVVTSANNPRLAALRSACEGRPATTLHIDAGNLAEMASQADIAIGAAGGAALERCCIGLPTITLVIAPNQAPGARALDRLGAAMLVQDDPADVLRALTEIADDRALRTALGQRSAFLVDGKGAGRVARLLGGKAMALHLRHAVFADAELLLSWRNDPAVRAASLQQDVIALAEHEAWLTRLLVNPDRQLLVAMSGETPVGTIRFDHGSTGVASVSLTIAPGQQGRGFGAELLGEGELWAVARKPTVQLFEAVVRSENLRSQALFTKAGYVLTQKQDDRIIYHKPCGASPSSLPAGVNML